MATWLNTVLVGIGATATMDAWSLVRRRWLGVPLPDYGLVGRWLGRMPRGRFRHAAIGAAPAVRGERLLGWTAHYLVGISFAGLLPLLWDASWFRQPSPGPALWVGVGTVAAPWFLMQPGMGAGIAASRTPRPWAARLQSLLTHAVFGLGLYATAWLLRPGFGSP